MDVSHLENAQEPLSVLDTYRPALGVKTKEDALTYFCSLVAYYMRVEGLSKREASNLAGQTLSFLVR